MIHLGLVVCICTYKRVGLLKLLLDDIAKQTKTPSMVVLVDGDPNSGEVKQMLLNIEIGNTSKIIYVPSDHANLSYQRYLGWLVTKEKDISYLLYLDDDLRLNQFDAIERLVDHIEVSNQFVGCTSLIRMGSLDDKFASQPAFIEHYKTYKNRSLWLSLFGSSRKTQPGGLSPYGNRVLPVQNENYAIVEWLRGGVMLFRMKAFVQECFSEDLFALDHIRCGKGEDTFLSRQAMQHGKLIYVNDVVIDHPNSDLPKTYPISAYNLAYATAYSRRFLNDHYRVNQPPQIKDRLALIQSYIGNNLINIWRAFIHLRRFRFAYALGYLVGSLRGLLQKPTAKNLTPDIDWWADAELAIANQIRIK